MKTIVDEIVEKHFGPAEKKFGRPVLAKPKMEFTCWDAEMVHSYLSSAFKEARSAHEMSKLVTEKAYRAQSDAYLALANFEDQIRDYLKANNLSPNLFKFITPESGDDETAEGA